MYYGFWLAFISPVWGALNCIFPIVLPVYITVWVCIKHALYHENDKPTWHVNTSKSIYHCDIGTIVTSTCVSVKNDPWTLEHGLSETWRPCARLPAKLGLFSSFVFSSISHKTNAKFCLFLDMCDCEDALEAWTHIHCLLLMKFFSNFWHLKCKNLHKKKVSQLTCTI